jgi:AcrR family transcriptional regulator
MVEFGSDRPQYQGKGADSLPQENSSEQPMPDVPGSLFDPNKPILAAAVDGDATIGAVTRSNQRMRRAQIRAATRKLLAENGCDAVTVRDIARASGFALQTVYNLGGPREQLIIDAISEYSLFVGRMASRKQGVSTLPNLVDTWIESAQCCPEFARQCNLIVFTRSRPIYYRFRDIQIRGMTKLLRLQRENGQMLLGSSPRKTAEQLVFYATAIWIDWADRPFPFPQLRDRLVLGMTKLLRD